MFSFFLETSRFQIVASVTVRFSESSSLQQVAFAARKPTLRQKLFEVTHARQESNGCSSRVPYNRALENLYFPKSIELYCSGAMPVGAAYSDLFLHNIVCD